MKTFQVSISFNDLFLKTTIAAQAKLIEKAQLSFHHDEEESELESFVI